MKLWKKIWTILTNTIHSHDDIIILPRIFASEFCVYSEVLCNWDSSVSRALALTKYPNDTRTLLFSFSWINYPNHHMTGIFSHCWIWKCFPTLTSKLAFQYSPLPFCNRTLITHIKEHTGILHFYSNNKNFICLYTHGVGISTMNEPDWQTFSAFSNFCRNGWQMSRLPNCQNPSEHQVYSSQQMFFSNSN